MSKDEIKAHIASILPFLPPNKRDITVYYCNTCQRPIEPEWATYDHRTLTTTCMYCHKNDVDAIRIYYTSD